MHCEINEPDKKSAENPGNDNSPANNTDPIGYDVQWKSIIKAFFFPMLQSLMPKLAADADSAREPEYLEQELSDLTAAIDGPTQHIDILAKVPMKKPHRDIWLVLHIEVQGEKGGDLPERMFFYNSALRLKHLKKSAPGKEQSAPETAPEAAAKSKKTSRITKPGVVDVVSFAILTAHRPKGEKEFFERVSYDNRLIYEYPAVKLWELDEAALAASENPFDWALLSGLYVIKSGKKDISRFSYLKTLSNMLDAKGWSLEEKVALYRFMDVVLRPKSVNLQKKYRDWVSDKRKEGEKVYLSVAEEIGMEKGIIKGMERGRAEGRAEGIAKGMERGRAELARKLLSLGVEKEKIAEAAGLPVQEIENFIKEN